MKFEISAICDAATDYDGRLCMLGVTERILCPEFPHNLNQLCVVLRVRFHPVEEGEHTLRINMVDQDGHANVPPIEAHVQLDFTEGEDSQVQNFVLNLHGLSFEEEGLFSLDVAFDGRHEVSLPLWVLHEDLLAEDEDPEEGESF